MKKILTLLAFALSSLLVANHDLHRIERLVEPYEQAIEFVQNLEVACKVSDHDIFVFFTHHDLYEKKDVKKFNRVVRIVKKLVYGKQSLYEHRQRLEAMIDQLEKVEKFIVDHASAHYALITYYEIAARYYYIDEHHAAVVDLMVKQSDKLGLPNMQGRGLYKFAKKIDIDMRRLTTLFFQNIISDDLIVKINRLKIKLVMLQSKILEHKMYARQVSKTRWLKAFGIILPALLILSVVCFPIIFFQSPPLTHWVIGAIVFYATVSSFVTIKELNESMKYNIPVRSTSLFSWFTPIFFPLTWIPRA